MAKRKWTNPPSNELVQVVRHNLRFLSTPLNAAPEPEPDRKDVLRWIGRSTTVIGGMFEGIAERKQVKTPVAAFIIRVGRMFWGIVEAAIPGSILRAFALHWFALLLLLEALLIFGAILFDEKPVQAVALKLLLLTLALWVIVQIAYLFLRKLNVLAIVGSIAAIVLLIPLVVGILDLTNYGLQALSDGSHSSALRAERWIENKIGVRPHQP